MSLRRSSKGWGRRPRSAIARWVSYSGWLDDSMSRSCSLSRSSAGCRALPARGQELRNCALRELRPHALVLGVQVAPQFEASARPDRSGAR
eukprot:3904572-Alexandrium_andersonii.AAC.1